MADRNLTLSVQVEGIGDGKQRTIDGALAAEIAGLVRESLRERYEDIGPETEIDLVSITPPNDVVVHLNQPADGDSTDTTDVLDEHWSDTE